MLLEVMVVLFIFVLIGIVVFKVVGEYLLSVG